MLLSPTGEDAACKNTVTLTVAIDAKMGDRKLYRTCEISHWREMSSLYFKYLLTPPGSCHPQQARNITCTKQITT